MDEGIGSKDPKRLVAIGESYGDRFLLSSVPSCSTQGKGNQHR